MSSEPQTTIVKKVRRRRRNEGLGLLPLLATALLAFVVVLPSDVASGQAHRSPRKHWPQGGYAARLAAPDDEQPPTSETLEVTESSAAAQDAPSGVALIDAAFPAEGPEASANATITTTSFAAPTRPAIVIGYRRATDRRPEAGSTTATASTTTTAVAPVPEPAVPVFLAAAISLCFRRKRGSSRLRSSS